MVTAALQNAAGSREALGKLAMGSWQDTAHQIAPVTGTHDHGPLRPVDDGQGTLRPVDAGPRGLRESRGRAAEGQTALAGGLEHSVQRAPGKLDL